MAVSAKEYLENPMIFKVSHEARAQRCANPDCNVILSGTVTGREPTATGHYCSDCYYESFSAVLDLGVGRFTR